MYLLEELLHCALVPVLDEQAVAFSHLAEASYARRSEPACRHLVKPRNDPCGYLTPELTCRRSSSPSELNCTPGTHLAKREQGCRSAPSGAAHVRGRLERTRP